MLKTLNWILQRIDEIYESHPAPPPFLPPREKEFLISNLKVLKNLRTSVNVDAPNEHPLNDKFIWPKSLAFHKSVDCFIGLEIESKPERNLHEK